MTIPTFDQCVVEVHAGNVGMRESACGNFVIFNYRPTLAHAPREAWNEVNKWCRGLIFDLNTRERIAIPFKKFWGIGQHPEATLDIISKKNIRLAVEKMDGSLGICFWDNYQGKPRVATRGSFQSDQAVWATTWIQHHATDVTCAWLRNSGTILAEIIYADNRIVVNYGDWEGLSLLAAVLPGQDHSKHPSFFFGDHPVISAASSAWKRPEIQTKGMVLAHFAELAKTLDGNKEGWVLVLEDDQLIKIKGDQYLQMHRLRFNLTRKTIREALTEGLDPMGTIPSGFPDEWLAEVDTIAQDLKGLHSATAATIEPTVAGVRSLATRKDQAFVINDMLPAKLRGAAFALLDQNMEEYARLIWNSIE